MPFVTKRGAQELNSDIIEDSVDRLTGQRVKGNGYKSIPLTGLRNYSFDVNAADHKEIVMRGTPNIVEKNWIGEFPVFKVLTNRFTSGTEDNPETVEGTDWGRFIKEYEETLYANVYFYEPDLTDIIVDNKKKKHFPLWVIDRLIALGEFELALNTNKVDMVGVPRLTKLEYDDIMEEIEKRRKLSIKAPVGNVSRSTKSSES
jgi:hypothetical protein